MKVIVRKSTGKVIYIARDTDVFVMIENGIKVGNTIFSSLTGNNCFILENETLPVGYNMETLAFINGNYVELDALALVKREKLHELKELFSEVYSSAKLALNEYFLTGEAIPAGIKTKIALIKERRLEIVNEINLLQTVKDVLAYPLPYDQAEKFKEKLAQL